LQEQHSPYSGRGYIIVPYLKDIKIAVEFNNVTINTDYQLISGVVETSYNPDWKNVSDVEDFTGEGQGGQIEETVSFVIEKIVVNANGDIVVNGEDGQQITIPGGKDTVITDSGVKDADGKIITPPKVYNVDSKGNGTNVGTAFAEGGKSTPENTDGVDKSGQATEFTAKGISITFSPESNSKYAFDALPDNLDNIPAALQNLYKKAGKKPLPYKAVLNGDTDTLLANVTVTDANIKLDSIVFKSQSGAKIDFKRSDKVFVLTVKGNQTYAEEQILATIKQGGKWKVIGAFMLVHISPKEVNVALVPTDDVSAKRLDNVISKTQEIYNKVGVKINFKKEGVLNIDSVVSGNTIQTEKNTLTSTYSKEQQNINSLYQSTDNSYVLFITDKESSTKQQGYMRLNGQFGYVFKSGLPKTPAHELGHGIFKLEHPFELYKTQESSTDLLMDYSQGTIFNHQDWKQINDPAFKLYAFQSQASGEAIFSILDEISKYDRIEYSGRDIDLDSYFNEGKVDILGGGDRIIVKDKTGKVLETYASPNYDFSNWQKIKKRFWTYALEKSNESWEWDETYQSYTLGNEKKNNNWYGSIGTLTMNIKEKKIHFNFDKFTLNMLGSIYIGPNNPKNVDGTDDYSREPQDLVDAAARAHDHGYDLAKAKGVGGATINKNALQADIQLVRSSNKVIDMYSKKEIDPYTKNTISKETLERAKKVVALFTILCKNKAIDKTQNMEMQMIMSKTIDVLVSNINLTINDVINPVDEKGKKIKKY